MQPKNEPAEHWQNPADPTRKGGDVTPVYADDRQSSGEDLEEPTPSKKTMDSMGAQSQSSTQTPKENLKENSF